MKKRLIYTNVHVNDPMEAAIDWDIITNNVAGAKTDGIIIMFGTIQRWNGYSNGHEYLRDMSEVFSFRKDEHYASWYLDEDGDLHCEAHHHDGTNRYCFRVVDKVYSEEEAEELLHQCEDLDEFLYTYTSALDTVCEELGIA